MICVCVTGVVIAEAISSLCYYSIFTTESPELLKATWRTFHWTQKYVDQALGYFPTNKLGLTRLATALHVWRSWKLLKSQQFSFGLKKTTWQCESRQGAGSHVRSAVPRALLSSLCAEEQLPCSVALPNPPSEPCSCLGAQQRVMDCLGVFSRALVCPWAKPRQTACFISCVIKMRGPNVAFCTKIIIEIQQAALRAEAV